MAFGIRTGTDDLRMACQSHQGSSHRYAHHAVDVSVQHVAFAHAVAAVVAGTAFCAHLLAFGCWEEAKPCEHGMVNTPV